MSTATVNWKEKSRFVTVLPSPETVNQLTHALGFALSIPAGILLISAMDGDSDLWQRGGAWFYASSLSLLYAASALSHSFESNEQLKSLFRTLDQVCIYLLIVGSFTPFALTCVRTPTGMAQLATMCLLALIGMTLRIRSRGNLIGLNDLSFCLLTGWIPILSIPAVLATGGIPGFLLVVAGAVAYTGGTIFLMNDHRNPYLHGIWHLATIAGSGFHYLFLLYYVAVL